MMKRMNVGNNAADKVDDNVVVDDENSDLATPQLED